MSDQKPMKLGILGGIIAIAGGIGLGHWLTSGTVPMTMKAIGDAPVNSLTGAFSGLAAYLALPQIPAFWAMIKQYIPFINEVKVLFPQELIDAVLASIKSGHVDIKAIVALFQGIDMQAVIKLVQSIIAAFGKTSVLSNDPVPTDRTAPTLSTPDGLLVDVVVIHI